MFLFYTMKNYHVFSIYHFYRSYCLFLFDEFYQILYRLVVQLQRRRWSGGQRWWRAVPYQLHPSLLGSSQVPTDACCAVEIATLRVSLGRCDIAISQNCVIQQFLLHQHWMHTHIFSNCIELHVKVVIQCGTFDRYGGTDVYVSCCCHDNEMFQ